LHKIKYFFCLIDVYVYVVVNLYVDSMLLLMESSCVNNPLGVDLVVLAWVMKFVSLKVSGSIISGMNFGELVHTEWKKTLVLNEAPASGLWDWFPWISRFLCRIKIHVYIYSASCFVVFI
jgi:hypothetical protein